MRADQAVVGMKPGPLITLMALLLGLTLQPASAAPCANLAPGLSVVMRSALASSIIQHFAENAANGGDLPPIRAVTIQSVFQEGDWTVIRVDPKVLDPVSLFYAGDPLRTRAVTQWAGAASPSERRDIAAWAKANAPGIPPGLAACFAYSVTS